MDKKIKVLFLDIDWTIFSHYTRPGVYDDESIVAIKEIQKQGVKVFICTARAFHSVKHIKLFDKFTPDGLILCNGGLIIYNGGIIYENRLDNELFYPLCESVLSLGLTLEATEIYNRFLIAPKSEEAEKFFYTYQEEEPIIKDYHDHHVLTAVLFAPPEMDEKIKSLIPKELCYFRFQDFAVDILKKENIKGEAVRFVIDYLNLSKDNAMAIGDDYSDISMIEEVKYGIAMGNARDELKEKAFYVTKEISEHGVKEVLEKYILKKED